jgi:hypothetical protein
MSILITLLFAAVAVNMVFTVLIYNLLNNFLSITAVNQASSYKESIGKLRKPMLPFKKEVVKGRKVTSAEELVDIADIPWEDAYKAMEDI